MKVQHKKTGRIAEIISQDEKLVRVHYIKEDTEQNMTVGTFKRWWKQVDDEEKQKADETRRAIENVKKMTSKQVADVVERVIASEKRKVAKKKKEVDSSDAKEKFKDEFINFCKSNELSLKTWEKVPSLYAIQIKVSDNKFKTLAEIRLGKNSYHVYCRERAITKGVEADLIKNYYLPMSVKNISYSDTKVYKKIVESEVKNYGTI